MYKSTGIIKANTGETSAKSWLYIECCPELGAYYRSFYQKQVYYYISHPTIWGPHISIVRGNFSDDSQYLPYLGKEIEFYYNNKIGTNAKHFWLPVMCDEAEMIRWELGLPLIPEAPFHLTFGIYMGYNNTLIKEIVEKQSMKDFLKWSENKLKWKQSRML